MQIVFSTWCLRTFSMSEAIQKSARGRYDPKENGFRTVSQRTGRCANAEASSVHRED
jgi:hypothetical protein